MLALVNKANLHRSWKKILPLEDDRKKGKELEIGKNILLGFFGSHPDVSLVKNR